MTLTATGLTVLRGADYLTMIRNEYERLTELTIDWDRDLFLGNITVIMADRLGEVSQMLLAVYTARSINSAVGVQLDEIAGLFGLLREPATASTVTLLFNGTPGAIVPSGTIASGGGPDGFARWSTLVNATLDASGNARVLARSLTNGSISANGFTITVIATPRTGVASVTNPSAVVVGADIESDAALRTRIRQTQQQPSAGTVESIRGALLQLADVQQCTVVENASSSTRVILGATLPPHSVNAVVFPEQDTTEKRRLIALALYTDGPRAGIESIGSESGTITGQDGRPKTVRWSHASSIIVPVVIAGLVLAPGFTVASVTPDITAAILARSTLQQIGEAVRYNGVLCDILAINGVDDIGTLTLAGNSGDFPTEALQIASLRLDGIT